MADALPTCLLDGALGRGKSGPIWRRVFDEFQALQKREAV
jgi:hypothetical protein